MFIAEGALVAIDAGVTLVLRHLDPNWIDIGALLSGVGYALVRRYRTAAPPFPLLSLQTGVAFASGAAIFPLLVLLFRSISDGLGKALLGSSKITLTVACFVALCALLDDVVRPSPTFPER